MVSRNDRTSLIYPKILAAEFKEELMIHCQAIYPSWLSIGDLAIGAALQEIGFCYGGLAKDFHVDYSRHLWTIQGWSFYSSEKEIVLDAVCSEALYLYALDVEDVSTAAVMRKARVRVNRTIVKMPQPQELKKYSRLFVGLTSLGGVRASIDLNFVPVSIEDLLRDTFGGTQPDRKLRLGQEILIQEQLLSCVPVDSSEYREIKANLSEVYREFWEVRK